jgi:hypothetical protein
MSHRTPRYRQAAALGVCQRSTHSFRYAEPDRTVPVSEATVVETRTRHNQVNKVISPLRQTRGKLPFFDRFFRLLAPGDVSRHRKLHDGPIGVSERDGVAFHAASFSAEPDDIEL